MKRQTSLRRFITYGCAGWVLELLFTGGKAAMARDRKLAARTYLWMHPIYGATGLALDTLHHRLGHRPRLVRALLSLGVIYAAEYGSGALLRRLVGECPWKYAAGVHVHGLIRLDYAPLWLAVALGFETARDALLAEGGARAVDAGAVACPQCRSVEPPSERIAA
jgi:uncharacterized membrane protein